VLAELTALLLAAGGSDGTDWFAISHLLTDALCTTAHDRVSGALVEDCHQAPDPERRIDLAKLRADKRLLTMTEHQYGDASVLVFEYSDSAVEARAFREDIGPQPGCWLDAFAAAKTPPPECDRQLVFIASAPGRKKHRFDMIACSPEQKERALEYVRDVTLGSGPKVMEKASKSPTRSVSPNEVARLIGMSSAELIAKYGFPDAVWARYPDGFQWLYPLGGGKPPGLSIVFSRNRRASSTTVPCP